MIAELAPGANTPPVLEGSGGMGAVTVLMVRKVDAVVDAEGGVATGGVATGGETVGAEGGLAADELPGAGAGSVSVLPLPPLPPLKELAWVVLPEQRSTNGPVPTDVPYFPGFSKVKSLLSAVVPQDVPTPILATAMSGRASKPAVSSEPPETVMGAQFMYISRFPILLNHVHAIVMTPLGSSAGTVYLKALLVLGPFWSRLPAASTGQPPSIE
jgi:hypothetical protein